MLSPRKDEETFVKWLLSEAIYYVNKGHPAHSPKAHAWASKTRLHKIIFAVADKFELPVTRSWYMWGGFVHSDYLDSPRFSTLCEAYSRNPSRTLALRNQIKKSGFPVDDLLATMETWVDMVRLQPSRDFLLGYYKEEPPEQYRGIYLVKQEITNYLEDIGKEQDIGVLTDRSNKLSKCINRFFENSSNFDDERLQESTFVYSEILENSLDKLSFINERRGRISKQKFSFFDASKHIFDTYVWNPYACEISENTIKTEDSSRETLERQKMINHQEKLTRDAAKRFAFLRAEAQKRGLGFSFEELEEYKKTFLTNQKASKVLTEAIGIYSRAKER